MSASEIRLVAKRDVAEHTQEFRFSRPEGFTFKAGQAIDLSLPGVEVAHAFSLVTAPHDREIAIATRMRGSDYKRALAALAPGSVASLDGPFGSLTLHRNAKRAAVFIAGGIGITPFMSMLRDAQEAGVERAITLLYSNRRPEDAAYLAELRTLGASLRGLRVEPVMTEVERRLVDENVIREHTTGLAQPLFYVAGPPPMVEAMRRALEKAGVEDEDVRSEDFFGYERESAPAETI